MSRFKKSPEAPNADGMGVPTKDSNLCRTPGCQRIWTITGYCRECFIERKASAEEQASDEVARANLARLRKMVGACGPSLPYDKNRKLA